MAFTSFNLSRLNSVFRRAVAAFGFGTDSAIRARVQEEAAGSAVWARFAPSVAGYPVLPRVAGNLQIDEPAALTALAGGGVSDVLSYTAPDFKVGNTMIPLSEYSFGLPFDAAADGGIMAQFSDDWGFVFTLPRGTWTDSTTPSSDWDTASTTLYKKIAFVNANPGRFTLGINTRALLNQESTTITEQIFNGPSAGASYISGGGDLLQQLNGEYSAPEGLIDLTGNINVGAYLISPTSNTIARLNGRALLKPDYATYDAAGTAAWVAAEVQLVTEYNSRLTGGQSITFAVNGDEYQPFPKASCQASYWSKNQAYTAGTVVMTPSPWAGSTVYVSGNMVRNSDKNYICTSGGTSASSGGPTGTGTGITDGTVTWDYSTQSRRVYICITAGTSENQAGAGPLTTAADITDGSAHWEYGHDGTLYWQIDDDTFNLLSAAAAQPNTLAGNTAYLDALFNPVQGAHADLYSAHKAAGISTYIFYWPYFQWEGILGGSRSDGRRLRSIYAPPYPYVVTPTVTTDYAGWEFYRGYHASYSALSAANGGAFRGVTLPELVLNAAAQNIEAGAPLMCPFVAGSWSGGAAGLLDDLYMGFIKFVYTAGSIGCVPGYYSAGPHNGTWTIGTGACDQARQYCIIGHVQATFSHLENYLRSGTLLEGDYDAWSLGSSTHIMSKNIYGSPNGFIHPSYEYVHNDTYQWYSKVIARKLNASNDWLICAWRCYDGPDTTLSVTIDGHALSVNARRGGTLYHMNNSGTLTMLDPLSMDPSRTIASILAGL